MYKLYSDPNFVIFLDGGLVIPFDPANRDYRIYLEWLSEGNEPLPADQPPEPEVTPSPEPEVVPTPEPEVVPTPEQETPAP